jgi:hypothetical protein
MSGVKRYDAVHIRYEERNIRYGEGCEVEVVAAYDYDRDTQALKAKLEDWEADANLLEAERDTLRTDNQRLREALEFASKSLAQVTSSDGSGHADIAIAALRISGVDPTETVQMVEVWKKTAGWRLDAALTTANVEGE